jgi:hypothetical protein
MKLNILHKSIASLALFAILVLFAGCPYSSSVPVDEGTVKIPNYLAGKWIKSSDKETENPTFFDISRDDNTNAKALKNEYSSSDSTYETTKYHLTFSDVDGDVFMNAIEDGGSSYSLYKFTYDESTGEITTYEVTDYIKETFNTSAELKGFISKNKSMSYFFTNTVDVYVRK